MSKERELLKRLAEGDNRGDFFISLELIKEVEAILAQPAPFKPDWVNYRQGIADSTDSKREPLSEATINYYLERLGSHFKWNDGFEAGVKWAEKAHGIGEQK